MTVSLGSKDGSQNELKYHYALTSPARPGYYAPISARALRTIPKHTVKAVALSRLPRA
jgi:hypothetical protein